MRKIAAPHLPDEGLGAGALLRHMLSDAMHSPSQGLQDVTPSPEPQSGHLGRRGSRRKVARGVDVRGCAFARQAVARGAVAREALARHSVARVRAV